MEQRLAACRLCNSARTVNSGVEGLWNRRREKVLKQLATCECACVERGSLKFLSARSVATSTRGPAAPSHQHHARTFSRSIMVQRPLPVLVLQQPLQSLSEHTSRMSTVTVRPAPAGLFTAMTCSNARGTGREVGVSLRSISVSVRVSSCTGRNDGHGLLPYRYRISRPCTQRVVLPRGGNGEQC